MHTQSRRWVSTIEFEKLSSGLPRRHLSRLLQRCDRTIRDWQTGRRPIPAWTADTLRMYRLETRNAYREMFAHDPLE